MLFVPAQGPPSGSGSFRGWRVLILLFAGLLTFGVLQPLMASAHGGGSPALLSVRNKTVVEGDSATTTANVKVVLRHRVGHKVSVAFVTRDGTAKAGQDYMATSGRVYFPKWTKKAFIRVSVIGDTVKESDEFFKVRLYGARHAKLLKRVGIVRILDNDPTPPPPPPPPPPPAPPALSVGDTKVDEGDAAYFKVTLDKPAADVVTFKYGTSDGTAVAGQDYDATKGVQSIDKGETSAVIKVMTREDSIYEPGGPETFFLNVWNVYNASVADGHGKAYIVDDDPAPLPKLSVSDTKVDEGDAAWFTVSLDKPAPDTVTFAYATKDGTATAGKDYDQTTGTAAILKGDSKVMVKVMTREDSLYEPGADETFFLDVSAVKGASVLDARGIASIRDDDPAPVPTLSVLNTKVDEGDAAWFKVELSAPAPEAVTFDFGTSDGTATVGQDYDLTLGSQVIPKGDDHVFIKVMTREDSLKEPGGDETFFLSVSNVQHASVLKDKGTAFIADDD